MIEATFSSSDIDAIRSFALNHVHHVVRRRALVLLLKSQGLPHKKIAEIADICENTMRSYITEYKNDGLDAITKINSPQNKGSLVQYRQVIDDYMKETPPASIKEACEKIGNLTGVTLKESQMRVHLRSLGYRFRKASGVPAKADTEVQEEFLNKQLMPRLQEAEQNTRTIYFVDAAHFVLGAFLGYLWSLIRIFIKTPSGRQRFNVLGALDAITKELFTVTNDTYITSTHVCQLLDMLATKSKNPITVVLDNAKYQRCTMVIEKAKSLGIELLFLPPYSPNLNLIERVWKFTRKHCLNSKYFSDFKLFKSAISTFLKEMHHKHDAELKTFLTLNFQSFKTPQSNQ